MSHRVRSVGGVRHKARCACPQCDPGQAIMTAARAAAKGQTTFFPSPRRPVPAPPKIEKQPPPEAPPVVPPAPAGDRFAGTDRKIVELLIARSRVEHDERMARYRELRASGVARDEAFRIVDAEYPEQLRRHDDDDER